MPNQASEAVYARECASQPGFSTSFSDPAAMRTSFPDYRRLCHKWQNICAASLRNALASNSRVRIRNTLFILNSLIKARAAHERGR